MTSKWEDVVRVLLTQLCEQRERLGLSTHEVARRAQCTQSTVSTTLRGRNLPSVYTLVRLTAALELRLILIPGEPDTLESHEDEKDVAPGESNPTGQLVGVDGVRRGDVSSDTSGDAK